jgi:Holliday junction resolvasome RuvABC endonuclease subunit
MKKLFLASVEIDMVYIGIDPGSVNGALGAINHNGEYIDSFNIEHLDKHIRALVFKSRILSVVDPKEGAQICMEQVHAMPKQGISSTWNFARAVGVISAVCELTNYPFHLVSPQKWKGYFGLTADKNEALDLARKLFPKAPLKLKKDINRAEALLIAEYWRQANV